MEMGLEFYKAHDLPRFRCGSETWPLTLQQTKRTEAMEMKFLTSLPGYNLQDYIRNEQIPSELGIVTVLEILHDNRIKWHLRLHISSNAV